LIVVALARVAAMDWPTVLRRIDEVLGSDQGRPEQAVQIAELVRQAGSYRWVGLYEVSEQELWRLAGVGRGACLPALCGDQGLSGAAVAARRAVVNDVTADPRYLTALPARCRRPSSRCWIRARVRWWEPWTWRAASGTPSAMPTAKRLSASLPPAAGCSPSYFPRRNGAA
jgi:hypothetical protein